jgi:hypothetical protein
LLLRWWTISDGIEFQDLNAVLINVDCYENIGWGVYGAQREDPCQNYVYGSTLIRVLHFLGLGSSNKIILGWLAVVVISYILADVTSSMAKHSHSSYITALLISISPPVLLLIERGNFDWLVFALVYFGASFYARGYRKLGFFVLVFSSLVKFYTFPLTLLCVFLMKNRKEQLFSLLIIGITFTIIVRDITQLRTIYIDGWFAAFGNVTWAKYLILVGIDLHPFAAALLGLLVTGILVLVIRKTYLNPIILKLRIDNLSTLDYFAMFSIFTFLSCFLAGQNFDYRLVFLIPGLWFLSKTAIRAGLSLILFLVAFFFSYNVLSLQPIGDLAINLIVAVVLLALPVLLNQFNAANLRVKSD